MDELEVKKYCEILVSRLWIIILITVLCLATSGVVSFYVLQPEYQAYTTLMVGKPQGYNERIEYSDILLNQKLVSTYAEIAKSKLVADETIKNMELNLIYKELEQKVQVELVKDTEIIKIEVADRNPEFAANIANEISQVFMKHVAMIMKIDNIQIIDKAEIPSDPVKPRPILNMVIAGVLGIMISILVVFFLEYLDNTIKTPDDVEKYLGLPVIGMIPQVS